MTMGSVYLCASPHEDTFTSMVKRAFARVRGRKPRVAITCAPMGNHARGRGFMRDFASKAFWGAEVETFTVAGEKQAMPPDEARAIVDRADVIFVSGGDPVLGAELLRAAGADAWLRDARARGAACMGISAGSIVLGAWWAAWPDDPPEGAKWDGGALVRCAGVVPDLVVDCHAEEDAWAELAMVAEMLDAAGERGVRRIGLPTGVGVVVAEGGAIEPVGGAPFEM